MGNQPQSCPTSGFGGAFQSQSCPTSGFLGAFGKMAQWLRNLHVPTFVVTTCLFLFGAWAILLIARGITFALTAPGLLSNDPVPPVGDILRALYIGAKFDARIAVFLTAPLALLLAIPWISRRIAVFRPIPVAVYTVIFALLNLVYIVDYGYFFYARQRVDNTIVGFFDDAAISFDMVWESYPVVWITLGFIALTLFFAYLLNKLLYRHGLAVLGLAEEAKTMTWKGHVGWRFGLLLLLTVMGFGQFSESFFPLRWSDAYFSTNRDLVLLGLNPVQNLYDQLLDVGRTKPDIAAVKAAYPSMAQWLHVDHPDPEKLDFWRTVTPVPGAKKRNVVLIIMESLSSPMTSFAPGDGDTTPNLKKLAEKGIYFPNYYASARTTARAVFSVMTGIPDANRDNDGRAAARGPDLVEQYLPMSDFDGYEKYYLIGGSASWANIRGLLRHNVPGIRLIEEADWESPKIDVWGISDLNLFRESIGVLNKSEKPFVAVIQTAGFHRPYTIPKDRGDFVVKKPSAETLKNYAFSGADEYNSLRFEDYSLGEFFRLAETEPWFNDTVFAVIGDHGLWAASPNMSAGYLACELQGYHVPFVIYAPGLISPGRDNRACGHTDLFPTLAPLAGVSVRVHGTGRNLFAPYAYEDARQYIAGDSEDYRILIEGNYCYIKKRAEGLYRLDDPKGKNLLSLDPKRAKRMHEFADNYYNITKYLLFNNKEKPESRE